MSNPNPYPGPAFAGVGPGAGGPYNRFTPNIAGHPTNGHQANAHQNHTGSHPSFHHQGFSYPAPSQRPVFQNPTLNNQPFRTNTNIAPAVPGNHTSLPYAHTPVSLNPANHLSSSRFPPPPYPPVPPLPFGVSAFQQPFLPQNQAQPSAPRAEITEHVIHQPQDYLPSSNNSIPSQTDQVPHPISKEEGELSEGELDQSPVEKTSLDGDEQKNGQVQVVQPASKTAGKSPDPNHKMGNVLERFNGKSDSAIPTPDNDSISCKALSWLFII